MIAVALVWSKLYSPTEGPINQILGWIGLPPGRWLSSPDTALGSIVDPQCLAAGRLLHGARGRGPHANSRRRFYEAARLDGAGPLQRFVYVTLPLLRRTLLFSAVIAVINAVQVFEPVALITQGGPVGATNVLTYHIRRVGIERSQGGLGSAMAVTLMLALIVDDRRAVRLCAARLGGCGMTAVAWRLASQPVRESRRSSWTGCCSRRSSRFPSPPPFRSRGWC